MAKKPWKPPTPPIGTPIQWFRTGRREGVDHVMAGVVHQNHHMGHVTVLRHSDGRTIPQVPHISDPQHQQRRPDSQAHRGAWDFIPGMVPETAQPLSDDEERALELLKTMSAAEVAKQLGAGWTSQRVAAIRRERSKTPY